MPSISLKSCGAWPEYDVDWHGDNCRATSRERDGFWRWFLATIRCDCPCHKHDRKSTTKPETDA